MDNHYNLTWQGKHFVAAFNRINNELQLYQLVMLVLNLKRFSVFGAMALLLQRHAPFLNAIAFFSSVSIILLKRTSILKLNSKHTDTLSSKGALPT